MDVIIREGRENGFVINTGKAEGKGRIINLRGWIILPRNVSYKEMEKWPKEELLQEIKELRKEIRWLNGGYLHNE